MVGVQVFILLSIHLTIFITKSWEKILLLKKVGKKQNSVQFSNLTQQVPNYYILGYSIFSLPTKAMCSGGGWLYHLEKPPSLSPRTTNSILPTPGHFDWLRDGQEIKVGPIRMKPTIFVHQLWEKIERPKAKSNHVRTMIT